MRPTTLMLQHPTGFNTSDGFFQKGGTEVAATAKSFLQYVRAVTETLPLDAADERVIDALVARKMVNANGRPLRRRG